jgi:hypothetical protein
MIVPALKKQLHMQVSGNFGCYKDWWRLVFDEESKRLYVEHEWEHVDPNETKGDPLVGTTGMSVDAFLAQTGQELILGERQAQEALIILLRELTY